MTALPNKHSYNGHCRATEIEGDQRTPGRDFEKKMGTAGFRYSWRRMEAAAQSSSLWPMLIAPPGATRHTCTCKYSQVKFTSRLRSTEVYPTIRGRTNCFNKKLSCRGVTARRSMSSENVAKLFVGY